MNNKITLDLKEIKHIEIKRMRNGTYSFRAEKVDGSIGGNNYIADGTLEFEEFSRDLFKHSVDDYTVEFLQEK